MEYYLIDNYLLELRKEGYDIYNKEEMLIAYEKIIYSMEQKGYDDVIEEYDFDMEYWDLLNDVKNIIKENKLVHTDCFDFINKFQELDNRFLRFCYHY